MKKTIFITSCLLALSPLKAVQFEPQFENEKIAIFKVTLEPWEELDLDNDTLPNVLITLQDGSFRIGEANGHQGVAIYQERVDGEPINKGDGPIELIHIQLKSTPEG